MGFSQELVERWNDLGPSQRVDYARVVAEHSTEVAHTVENLLVAARSDVGGLTIRTAICDLTQLISQVLKEMGLGGEHVVWDQIGVPRPVLADPLRVRQVIRNLLINASNDGRPPISVALDERRGWVNLRVSDSGRGLPVERAQGLFRELPADELAQTPSGNLGIGLAVARRLTRMMHGELALGSNGPGAEVVLTLPAADPTKD